MAVKYQFPENFWWGAATSGPQAEGRFHKAHRSVFDYWFDTEPEAFFHGVGPDVASNFYNDYEHDIALMKRIGLNSMRTSIQWTRLIKDFETGETDPDGVRFYNAVIDEFLKQGIRPILNLHHFDLPIELYEKYGGWESKHVVELFAIFAKLGGRIGIVLNLTPAYPRSDAPEDVAAAKFAEDYKNNSFLDPAVHGTFTEDLVKVLAEDGVLWESTPEELDIIKNHTVDFLGINYYQPFRAKARETPFDASRGWLPEKHFESYEMPGRRMNPYRGWEIYPKAIYDIAINVRDNLGNIPWYISENGMGVEGEEKYRNADGFIEDDYRIDFIKEDLEWLHKGIEEGSNCFDYHLWTPIDCWFWSNAYKNRYGFIALDLKTQEKTIKKSGNWIRDVIANHGF